MKNKSKLPKLEWKLFDQESIRLPSNILPIKR